MARTLVSSPRSRISLLLVLHVTPAGTTGVLEHTLVWCAEHFTHVSSFATSLISVRLLTLYSFLLCPTLSVLRSRSLTHTHTQKHIYTFRFSLFDGFVQSTYRISLSLSFCLWDSMFHFGDWFRGIFSPSHPLHAARSMTPAILSLFVSHTRSDSLTCSFIQSLRLRALGTWDGWVTQYRKSGLLRKKQVTLRLLLQSVIVGERRNRCVVALPHCVVQRTFVACASKIKEEACRELLRAHWHYIWSNLVHDVDSQYRLLKISLYAAFTARLQCFVLL